ncbi:MAG: DUF3160 domain-containing protein [Anaerolineae bacterium]
MRVPTLLRLSLLLAAFLPLVACALFPSPATPEATATAALAPTATEVPAPSPLPTEAIAASPSPVEQPAGTPTAQSPPEHKLGPRLAFASYAEPAVQAVPAAQHEAIAPDLSNVIVPFVLSEAQLQRLAQNGFVVSPGLEKEFFTVYEKARYANEPIFVTSDSLLHIYHLLFDKVLRTAETQYFIPLLRELNQALLARADEQYQALQSSDWEEAARRTVAFIGIASKLLDPATPVPAYAANLVDAELNLIGEAAGILPSPLFPGLQYGEDYSQYIPRGHYTKTEELQAYFKSMMWYGRMTFRLKTEDPGVGRAETRSALLLVQALRNAEIAGRPALEAWADLYNPTAFFVGRSDDLTVTQYLEVMDAIYGENVDLAAITDEAKLDAFIEAANQLPPPRILGIVVWYTQDEEETTKGLRFMGQRFVPDAYIFRQLIFRNVGTLAHRRGLPKGLDILAAMGSERAYQILDEMGETTYENYPQQMAKMQEWLAGLSIEDWTETLYNAWLYCFQPLLASHIGEQGYPAFMQSPAWVDKQLNTVLGSWAELKHDTILYAKQAYAELGAGPMPPEPVPPKGCVEPVPYFYARLAALTAMTREGLGNRGLLAEQDSDSLQRLEELARALQVMAEKELRNEPLNEEEYTIIRYYGGELEHLTMAAADTEETGGIAYMEEEPQAAIIADVATDPQPLITVLEEAVGRINVIYVVVPVADEDSTIYLQVAKGGTFSYYEFPWPAEDRLTDEKWRQMLDEGTAPPPPQWIESFFTTEGEYSDLTAAVFRTQMSLHSLFWYLEDMGLSGVSGSGLDYIRRELQALRAEQQYVGHQLISSGFRSFDRQAEDEAVVTVRETWLDKLYQYSEFPGEGGSDPIAERGPYTLDVTYSLKRWESSWAVTNIVYANEPPAW